MSEEIENQDSKPEEEQQPNAENEFEDEKTNEELDKAKEVAENQKIRAEKAEKELKALKAKKEETKTPKKVDKEEKSNEPDYAKLAFLKGEKVDNPDDQKLVLDEAERLKLPLTDILNMKHIKSQLKDNKDQREAEGGSPKGKGKPGGTGQHDVDWWVDQKNPDGTYKTPSDPKLAGEVIDARTKKEANAGMFSEDLYNA